MRFGRFPALVALTLTLAVVVPADAAPLLVAPEANAECAAVLRTVERAGLYLPGNFRFRCPDTSYSFGVTGYDGKTGWVSLNLDNLRSFGLSAEFTMAHETCHAWDFATIGWTSEDRANGCAAAHGFTLHGGFE